MKFIAVDDERLALDNIVALVKRCVPDAQIAAFSDADDALAALKELSPDVALLDIHLGEMSGLELAKRCKAICPNVNIIFVTGYSQYTMEAIKLRASGYLVKPVRADDLLAELENLRNPVAEKSSSRLRVQTFGNFEVFVGDFPLGFSRSKCKECLAYLVDRRGAEVTAGEIAAVLFEEKTDDSNLKSYIRTIISELCSTLAKSGVGDVVIKGHNKIALDVSKVDCDLYKMLLGDVGALNSYFGQYMHNYSWAEMTLAKLESQFNK